MKIALTVKGSGLGAWLDNRFIDCMQVMFVDENNEFDSWVNPYREKGYKNALALADAIIAENINILVTGPLSPKISDYFQAAGVKVVVKDDGTVLDLVEEVRNDL